MKTFSNNFAFCISEYLQNRYNFLLDERICYILGCSWGLQKLSRKNSLFISSQKDFSNLSLSYLESFNPYALEFFVTNLRAIYRIDHNNDMTDARWIASDYQTLGKIKTFVTLSNSLFAKETLDDNQPIYGVAFIEQGGDPEFDFEQIKYCSLQLNLLNNYTINLPVNEFVKHWKIDNCEMFNANRYVIISPQFKSLLETLPCLVDNSLRMNYLRNINESVLGGSKLLRGLTKNLQKNQSEECVKEYVEFFLYSLKKNSLLGRGDMDRKYLSDCFQYLSIQNYIKSTSIVDVTERCGMYWESLFRLLQDTEKISFSELSDALQQITDAESKFEKTLKTMIKI